MVYFLQMIDLNKTQACATVVGFHDASYACACTNNTFVYGQLDARKVTIFDCRWVCYLCCALYHVVILGSHILGISDVVPLADQKVTKSTFNHPAIMYHMWFIHTIFYLLCTFTSQGVISKRNYKDACQAYDYDGQWYKSETKCRTCDVVKPARSKHCSKLSTSLIAIYPPAFLLFMPATVC